MKAEFQVLKYRPQLDVILTRDSVCAGDDCDAPHREIRHVYSFIDPAVLIREISSGYLPNIDGPSHSWMCLFNDQKVAEITANGIKALTREIVFAERNKCHFVYNSGK